MKKLGFISLAVVMGVGPVAASLAENVAEPTLSEIVITAQKRTESVQSVPVSVTVVSAEQIEREGVANVSDLSRSSASLEFGAPGTSSPGGGGYVRGIGTNSFGYTAQASVGIVLDGVVMGNANLLSLFDVQRIEVLKGPQGTLFGNSVSAGVINITTHAPDPTKRSGEIFAEYGGDALGSDYSRNALRATLNLPLTENSAIRLSLHHEQNDGVFHNTWLNSDSVEPDNGLRLRFLAKPSDAVTINLIGDYDKATSLNRPTLTYRIAPPGSALANALSDCGVTAGKANFNDCSEHQDRTTDLVRGLAGQIDAKVSDDITLTSITAWRNKSSEVRGDIETIPLSITSNRFQEFVNCTFGPPAPGAPPGCVGIYAILPGYGATGLQKRSARQLSEELRLASVAGGKVDWVAGLFYQDFKNDIDEGGLINGFFTGGNFGQTDHNAKVKTTDYAAFGNATVHFTDELRGILGLRYTHSKVSESGQDISVPPPNDTMNLSVEASKINYRLGLQYDVARHLMGYATVSTGYKGPQISDNISGKQVYGVQPEIPTSVELGVKASAFENRLALDADVFYTSVKNYQGQLCAPNNQGTITCVPANVSKVVTKGVEFDIFGAPFQGLNLNFTGIYNPAEYPNGYLASDGTNLGGTQLTRSSKTKLTFSGEYAWPIGSVSLVVGANATYRSKQSIYPSTAQEFIVPAGEIYDVRVGVKGGEDWGVYLFGRNLGNQHFPRDLFPTPFQTGGLWQVFDASDRKLVGLQLNMKF